LSKVEYKAVEGNYSDNLAVKFVDLAIKLDFFQSFPENEIFRIEALIRKNPFALSLLRGFVIDHFSMNQRPYNLRQRFVNSFKSNITRQSCCRPKIDHQINNLAANLKNSATRFSLRFSNRVLPAKTAENIAARQRLPANLLAASGAFPVKNLQYSPQPLNSSISAIKRSISCDTCKPGKVELSFAIPANIPDFTRFGCCE
jgi:hypothetical protein